LISLKIRLSFPGRSWRKKGEPWPVMKKTNIIRIKIGSNINNAVAENRMSESLFKNDIYILH